jgi:predicted ATP-dependent endonuclease of OLD family
MNELQQAYIRKIRLKNYKSIRDLEIDFHPGLNIIIGQNGSGKTNFVRAITSLLSENLNHELPAGFEFSLDFLNQKSQNVYWTGHIREIAIDNQSIKHSKIKVYNSDIRSNKKNIEADNLLHPEIIQFLASHNLYFFLSPDVISFGLPTQLSYISKLDGMNVTVTNDSTEITFYEDDGQNYISPIIFFKKRAKKTIADLKKMLKVEKNLVLNLNRFSPIQDCRLSEGHSIQQKENIFIINHIILEFFVNNNWYSWEQLSDGTKRLFYIISKVLAATYLVVIEEPEMGIHPDQLYKLMDFLKEQAKKKQIIITTHAPDALNALTNNELHKIIVTRFDLEKGTLMHHLSPQKIEKARAYMSAEGLALKDFWVHSNLEEVDETAED